MKKNLSEQLAKNLAYYTVDPDKRRCSSELGRCKYSGTNVGKKTKGCFVGSLMSAKDRIKADQHFSSVGSLIEGAESVGIKLPKIISENRGIMTAFQSLHDESDNWSSNGLSFKGKIILKSIIQKNSLDIKYFEKFLVD
jgi:hypothetical protein